MAADRAEAGALLRSPVACLLCCVHKAHAHKYALALAWTLTEAQCTFDPMAASSAVFVVFLMSNKHVFVHYF